jgi:hypothetical protein
VSEETRSVVGRISKIRAASEEQLAVLSNVTASLDPTREAKNAAQSARESM